MAKPHWFHDEGAQHFGCQAEGCDSKASVQWQRAANTEEIHAHLNAEGPHGKIHRNPDAAHTIAVFACDTHALPPAAAVTLHEPHCPAPDTGCECP